MKSLQVYNVPILLFVLAATGEAAPEFAAVVLEPGNGRLVLSNDGDRNLALRGARVDVVAGDSFRFPVTVRKLAPGATADLLPPTPLPAPGGARLVAANGEVLASVAWPALPDGTTEWRRGQDGIWRAGNGPCPVVVNEVCPGADWIELWNPSADSADLSGFTVAGVPLAPGTSIAGEGFLTVTAPLPDDGCGVLFLTPAAALVDAVACGPLDPGLSFGRVRDGQPGWARFETPSKGKANKKGVILGLGSPSHAKGDPDHARVFDLTQVRRIDIGISPAEWEDLRRDLRTQAPRPYPRRDFHYVEGTFRFDGLVWERVGIRYRGSSSIDPWFRGREKLPFKVDFDQFEDSRPETKDQMFFGMKAVNLRNNAEDPTQIRDLLTMELLREAGAPVSHGAPVRLFVNGVYHGLYTLTEQVDEIFCEARFGNDSGNLYKPEGAGADLARFREKAFEKETNEEAADWSDVETLVTALGDRSTDVSTLVEMDGFLAWLAVTVAVVDYDSYLSMRH
ncbi:MAG: CotH kinase family protein, partial [Planctomycetes bacterium]|nr:CotH kinase family protein [Planctomycetota bacterium]